MIDARLSRVRMRDLASLGRSRRTGPAGAASAAGTPVRPRAASSRPGTDDFVASIIETRAGRCTTGETTGYRDSVG